MESEIKSKLVHQSAAQNSPVPPEQTSKLGIKQIKAKPEPGIRTKHCSASSGKTSKKSLDTSKEESGRFKGGVWTLQRRSLEQESL